MQWIMRLLIACIAIFNVSGCAMDPGRPNDAKGFSEVASRQGLATLYIYRPAHEIARAVWPEVHFNDQKVVGLKNESYTVVHLKMGRYSIRTEKSSAMSGMGNIPGEFEIQKEGTYFLKFDRSYKQFMSYTGIYASPSFTTNYERWVLVPREQALSEISKCYFLLPYVDSVAP